MVKRRGRLSRVDRELKEINTFEFFFQISNVSTKLVFRKENRGRGRERERERIGKRREEH